MHRKRNEMLVEEKRKYGTQMLQRINAKNMAEQRQQGSSTNKYICTLTHTHLYVQTNTKDFFIRA